MRQYLDMLQHILDNGEEREDRTGVGTIGVFGYQNRFDLNDGFPLLTTKKMFTRGIFEELLWFLKGDSNIKYLVDRKVNIWNKDAYRQFSNSEDFNGESIDEFIEKIRTDDDFANIHGELGPVYGRQWRDFNGVDQIAQLEDSLKNNPYSRRHILTAWNPADIKDMALPPCHALVQFYVSNDGKLSTHLYQRSADSVLGVPFNIASYAALTHMFANAIGYEPGEFVHTFGDLHIYKNHLPQVEEQLSREPLKLPTLWVNPEVNSIFDYKIDDLKIEGYESHPPIKATLNADDVTQQAN